MAKTTKELTKGFLDLTVAAVIAGPTIGIIQASSIPVPLKTGTSSLVGVGLLKGGFNLLG